MFQFKACPHGQHAALSARRGHSARPLRIRPLVRQVHLWLGLTVGALFAVLGLTGSALVFYVGIDEALNTPEFAATGTAAPGWDSPVWDRVLATGLKQWPQQGGKFSIEATGNASPIPARYYPPSQHHGHHAERLMLWFAPDGTSVIRADTWGDYLMSWLYELHMHLLAGETGRQIVGWSGFAMLVLLATGIAAWWPRGSWRKALAFKRNAAAQRRLRDLHKHAGLWSALLLFLLALTGALLALPDVQSKLLTASVAPPEPAPAPLSTQSSGDQVRLSQALATARAALPGGRLAFIDVPVGGNDPIRLRMQVPGDPHRRFPGSFVFIDQYSGSVLAVHDVRTGNGATQTAKWIRPIHDGSIAGMPTRILAVLVGLMPAMLMITGLLHWRKRRIARQRAPFHHHA